jgi:hypothetical protein
MSKVTKNNPNLAAVRAAKAKAVKLFASNPNVTGIGIARMNGGFGVKLNFVTQPSEKDRVPQEIDGVPIRVEVVGSIGARKAD